MEETTMYCHCSSNNGMRNFLTREEKIEMLEEYKQMLEKETLGVTQKIESLRKQ